MCVWSGQGNKLDHRRYRLFASVEDSEKDSTLGLLVAPGPFPSDALQLLIRFF